MTNALLDGVAMTNALLDGVAMTNALLDGVGSAIACVATALWPLMIPPIRCDD